MKKSFALGALALVSALGIGSVARGVYANQSQRPVAAVPVGIASRIAQAHPVSTQAQAPDGNGDGEQPDDQEEAQEDAQLQTLAKITPQQAEAAARTVASGTVSNVTLENEDGSVVYKVMIGQQEVMVDAGNGTVLETESAGHESDQDAAPQGSIQVPDDGDQGGDQGEAMGN